MNRRKFRDSDGGKTDNPDRREFGRMAMGGVLGLGATSLLGQPPRAAASVPKIKPGIKLCAQSSASPTDEQLLFLKQIGAEYVSVGSTAGPAYRRRLHPDQEALRGRGHHGLEHRQHRCA